jgi:hypothetical protein
MWRYLNAALLATPRISGLERVRPFPILLVFLGGMTLIHHYLWAVPLIMMSGLVLGLSTNRRFREIVDAQSRWSPTISAADSPETTPLAAPPTPTSSAVLDPESRRQFDVLNAKAAANRQLASERGLSRADLGTLDDGLRPLLDLARELLVRKQRLLAAEADANPRRLRESIAAAEADLAAADTPVTDAVLASRRATLDLLRRRLNLSEDRGEAIDTIVSDLDQIRARLDLTHDEAVMGHAPPAVATRLNLASRSLDARLFESHAVPGDDRAVRT